MFKKIIKTLLITYSIIFVVVAITVFIVLKNNPNIAKQIMTFTNNLTKSNVNMNELKQNLSNFKDTESVKKTYYDSGALKAEMGIKRGQRHGVYKSYYEKTGTLQMKTTFIDNKQQGIYTDYYENGALHSEVEYRYDKKNGNFSNYFPNGKIQSKGIYINDNLEGEVIEYYDTGEIHYIENYDKGNRASRIEYDKAGKMLF